MSTFLFLLRTYAEVDHIAPLIWKCLEKGDRALAILHHTLSHHHDARLALLKTYPGFEILSIPGPSSNRSLVRLASRLTWTRSRALRFLEWHRVAACFVGTQAGLGWQGRLASEDEVERGRMAAVYVPGRGDLTRLFGCILRPLTTALLLASQERRTPTFCLPHGVGTRVNTERTRRKADLMRRRAGGQLDWRSRFTMTVFASELHRQRVIAAGRVDPAAAQAWGSLRFCPQWLDVLDGIRGDEGGLPSRQEGQVRVAFMVPKWQRAVDRAAAESLLLGLAARGDVRLILKTHPSKGALGNDLVRKLEGHPTVHLAGKTDSSTLIRNTDVTIVESSSVAIEALMRGKHLIYASYLRPIREVYDEYGGCLVAHAPGDVHRFLDQIMRGSPPVVDARAQEQLVSALVYAGRAPFDVPEYYYGQIQRYLDPVSRPRIGGDGSR